MPGRSRKRSTVNTGLHLWPASRKLHFHTCVCSKKKRKERQMLLTFEPKLHRSVSASEPRSTRNPNARIFRWDLI